MELERFLQTSLMGLYVDQVKQLVTDRLVEWFRDCSKLHYKVDTQKMTVTGMNGCDFQLVVSATFTFLDKTYVRFDYHVKNNDYEFKSSSWRPPLQWVRYVQTEYNYAVNHKKLQKLLLQYFPLWSFTRLLFLAHCKNDSGECPLSMLPPEMLVKVNGYL